MGLFNQETITSLLLNDGIVHYYGKIMKQQVAQHYLDRLLHIIAWKQDEVVIFGKHIITKRKAAWYGDRPCAYTYSHTTKQALPWTQKLQELKARVEALLKP